MPEDRDEAIYGTTTGFSVLADASDVQFVGSTNFSHVEGDQYNNYNAPSEPDRLEEILSRIDFSFSYDCRRQASTPRIAEGKILEELKAWALSSSDGDINSRLCWVRSPRRAGKSDTAAAVAKFCDEQGRLAASFFFSKKDPNRNNPRYLIPAIAHGLALVDSNLRELIYSAIRAKPRILSTTLDAQFEHLVSRPLLQWRSTEEGAQSMLIILDGPNKCASSHEEREVLSMIASALNDNLPLRFLVFSRPDDVIWEYFNDRAALGSFTKFLLLDGDYTANENVRHTLTEGFRGFHSTDKNQQSDLSMQWPSNRDFETLIEKASGETEYAHTVIRFLEHQFTPHLQLTEILKLSTTGTVKTSLHSLYLHIVRSAGVDTDRMCAVVSIALFHAHPALIPKNMITRRFLGYLMPQLTSESISRDLEALRSCLSFQGPEDEIKAYHPSFLEFLLKMDAKDGAKLSSLLIQQWFSLLENIYNPEEIIFPRDDSFDDLILSGWHAMRLVNPTGEFFLPELCRIKFSVLLNYMLQISWVAPSKEDWSYRDPSKIGIAILYRQIEDLIPWLEGLKRNKEASRVLKIFKNAKSFFCITPTPTLGFTGDEDRRLRWIIMQIAGCSWKCEVTSKAWESLEGSSDGRVRVNTIGGQWETLRHSSPCTQCHELSSWTRTDHYRVDIRAWCARIAKDLSDEIRRNPSPEAVSNLVESSLLQLALEGLEICRCIRR
ncbi:hypothetical protein PQX77_006938 [Marasmius sp. AFHP31]|nr:hypothetical protein PQX77_006938 [Marasmius sp. AFHP31]